MGDSNPEQNHAANIRTETSKRAVTVERKNAKGKKGQGGRVRGLNII